MATYSANASSLTFNAVAVGRPISISFTESGNEIDVTSLASSTHVYLAGIKDVECQVEVIGVSSTAIGDTGAIAITWNDGSSDSIAGDGAVCTGNEVSGSVDGAIVSTLTFKPYAGTV